jgi:eukaryotic-like serine/threonine-protein kinase
MGAQTIAARYRVERTIGRGGMGAVWLARDERLGRDVAIKQIGTLPGETAPDLARAMREARSSAVLNHPHVVSIYDVVEADDHIWLVMEYVPSRTLWQIITADGPLSAEGAALIGSQIADGLAAAHAVGIVHRDVKPGNILVTEDQVAKISDFGIARAHDQGQLTSTGLVIGTPDYFSPQLARGEDPTPADDVWALGATLFTAVEGHPVYPHEGSPLALLATIASTPPPRAENAGFLTEPIGRMLDPNPDFRWSMGDAAHILRRLHERHARELTRHSTSALLRRRRSAPGLVAAPLPVVESGSAAPPSEGTSGDVVLDDRPPAPEDRRRRSMAGRLMLLGVAGLVALAALGGFLLWYDGSGGQPSATGHHTSSSTPPVHHRSKADHRTRSPTTAGASTQPVTTPSSTPTGVAQGVTGRSVTGASAPQFVRDYYAVLPSGTSSAWAALSPGFQAKIGGYGNYRGFWSTIASVSVGSTTVTQAGSVDVSLTYRSNDGRVSSEVRRIYLERTGSGYLITGDAVVG